MHKYFLLLSFFSVTTSFAQETDATEDPQTAEESSSNDHHIHDDSTPEPETSNLEEAPLTESEPTSSEDPVLIKVDVPRQIEIDTNNKENFKLLTPWSPKPKQQAPLGWRYVPASPHSAYPLKVTLSNGKNITLKITPYKIVPEKEKNVTQVLEPGYQFEQGYQQTESVSAKLTHTTISLKKAADSLDQSVQNLTALINSLPK